MPMISDDQEGGHYYSPSSFRHKLKSSICCFSTPVTHEILRSDYDSDTNCITTKPAPTAARSTWIHHNLEIKDRCRPGFVIGRRSGGRRYRSDDFRYDPESYSLNFEGEGSREDEVPFRSFTARLPPTPERFSTAERSNWSGAASTVRVRRAEMTGWS